MCILHNTLVDTMSFLDINYRLDLHDVRIINNYERVFNKNTYQYIMLTAEKATRLMSHYLCKKKLISAYSHLGMGLRECTKRTIFLRKEFFIHHSRFFSQSEMSLTSTQFTYHALLHS